MDTKPNAGRAVNRDISSTLPAVARMLGTLALAVVLTWLARHLSDDTMYVFLVAGVAIVTWRDGWAFGAAAAVLSIVTMSLFFITPIGSLHLSSAAATATQLVSFGLVAVLIIEVMHALREARGRADHHAVVAERARGLAEQLSNARERFLRTLSHEVRTPINAVLGYADLLDSGAAGAMTPSQTKYVLRLQLAARHLLTVVNGVLEIAKADEGYIEVGRHRLSVAASIEPALALIAPQAEAKSISVHFDRSRDDGLTFVGDADRVRQILVNLLGNAVKFTPSSGRIRVEWGTSPNSNGTGRSPGHVFIRITDSGPGIAPADHRRIFEPFERATRGSAARAEGTGLGLSISRRLARLMGGDIAVDSRVGDGASFILTLPSADKPGEQPAASGEPGLGNPQHRRRAG